MLRAPPLSNQMEIILFYYIVMELLLTSGAFCQRLLETNKLDISTVNKHYNLLRSC